MSNLLISLFVLPLRFLLPLPSSSGGSIDKAVGLNRQPGIPVPPAAWVVRLQWARGPPRWAAHPPAEPVSQQGGGWVPPGLSVALPRVGSQTLEALPLTGPRTLLARPLGLSRFGQFPGYRLDGVEQSLWTQVDVWYPCTR